MRLRSKVLAAALTLCATALPAMAQECGGDFESWKQGVAAEAKAAGVGAVGLDALEAATLDDKVLARDRAQGVFTQTFVEFSNRMISAYRLKQGAANMKKYADVFARADQQFGVQAPIIAAFWALETDFGAVQGDFHTLSALVTLSHDCRRPQLFRQQLVPLLELIDRGVLPADVRGAWAGEIGQTQILPSDYLARGVDGDGDGKIDLRGSVPDVIMTTANKVLSRGWKRDQPWIQEVRVPEDMPWDQTGRTNKLPLSSGASRASPNSASSRRCGMSTAPTNPRRNGCARCRPPDLRSSRGRARMLAWSTSAMATASSSRWRVTTTHPTSSPTRVRRPASAAYCATSSPWARGRSRR